MKLTLLDMVQDILSDMTSDEVNSIGDTVESLQVANLVQKTYFSMMANRNWAHLRKTVEIEGSGDISKPTHMRLPEGTKELCFINYNKKKQGETRIRYEEVKYSEPDAFLRRMNNMNSDSDTVDLVEDTTGVSLLIQNNKAPSYFTSFDDKNIVFDSYDSTEDSTLVSNKIQAMAYMTPSWSMSDEFIPDLPAEAFPALLAEAKSRSFLRINQQADQKAEQESVRQQRWLSQKNRRVNGGIQYPDYGRTSRK